jgi:hypothetical protein
MAGCGNQVSRLLISSRLTSFVLGKSKVSVDCQAPAKA